MGHRKDLFNKSLTAKMKREYIRGSMGADIETTRDEFNDIHERIAMTEDDLSEVYLPVNSGDTEVKNQTELKYIEVLVRHYLGESKGSSYKVRSFLNKIKHYDFETIKRLRALYMAGVSLSPATLMSEAAISSEYKNFVSNSKTKKTLKSSVAGKSRKDFVDSDDKFEEYSKHHEVASAVGRTFKFSGASRSSILRDFVSPALKDETGLAKKIGADLFNLLSYCTPLIFLLNDGIYSEETLKKIKSVFLGGDQSNDYKVIVKADSVVSIKKCTYLDEVSLLLDIKYSLFKSLVAPHLKPGCALDLKTLSIKERYRLHNNDIFGDLVSIDNEYKKYALTIEPELYGEYYSSLGANEKMFKEYIESYKCHDFVSLAKRTLRSMEYKSENTYGDIDECAVSFSIQIPSELSKIMAMLEDNKFKGILDTKGFSYTRFSTYSDILYIDLRSKGKGKGFTNSVQKILDFSRILEVYAKKNSLSNSNIDINMSVESYVKFEEEGWNSFYGAIYDSHPHLSGLGLYKGREDFTDHTEGVSFRDLKMGLKDFDTENWLIDPVSKFGKSVKFRYGKVNSLEHIMFNIYLSTCIVSNRNEDFRHSMIRSTFLARLGIPKGLSSIKEISVLHEGFAKKDRFGTHKGKELLRELKAKGYDISPLDVVQSPSYDGMSASDRTDAAADELLVETRKKMMEDMMKKSGDFRNDGASNILSAVSENDEDDDFTVMANDLL
jgi:hypothetical protein